MHIGDTVSTGTIRRTDTTPAPVERTPDAEPAPLATADAR